MIWALWLVGTLAYLWLVGAFLFVHFFGAHPQDWEPAWYVRPVVLASIPIYGGLSALFYVWWRRPPRFEL